jgi:hypothetical protein
VGGDGEIVVARIEALLSAPTSGAAAPTLARMESTLTDGYAEALALEAERWRIERRLGEVAGTAHEPAVADELSSLARRLRHAEVELGKLRAVLGRLQARARAVRHATASG